MLHYSLIILVEVTTDSAIARNGGVTHLKLGICAISPCLASVLPFTTVKFTGAITLYRHDYVRCKKSCYSFVPLPPAFHLRPLAAISLCSGRGNVPVHLEKKLRRQFHEE